MEKNSDNKRNVSSPSVENQIINAQLRWVGHLVRMENFRIPKAIFFSQLSSGKRAVARPRLWFLKGNLEEPEDMWNQS